MKSVSQKREDSDTACGKRNKRVEGGKISGWITGITYRSMSIGWDGGGGNDGAYEGEMERIIQNSGEDLLGWEHSGGYASAQRKRKSEREEIPQRSSMWRRQRR